MSVVHHPTEPIANARLLLSEFFLGEDLHLLVHHHQVFRKWTGTHWAAIEDGEIDSVIWKWLEHAVYLKEAETAKPVPFHPSRAKVAEIVAAVRAITHLPESVLMPSWPWGQVSIPPTDLLPMTNGLLHLPTRVVLPPRPGYFCGHSLPYAYDPMPDPPTTWISFLDQLWPRDTESQDVLQEVVGLLLTSDTSHQKIILIVGPPRAGKGTIARVITGLLGPENVAAPTLASFGTEFGLQPLIDRPVAIISDGRVSGRADSAVVERLLSISGEDSLSIHRKYKGAWTGRLPTRLLMVSNEIPRLLDSSGAISSRFLVLRLEASFLGKEDHNLTDKLLAERPGILAWALAGLDRLKARGHLVQPSSSDHVVRQMADLASPITAFLEEHVEEGPSFTVPAPELYRAWVTWCGDQGIQQPGTVQMLGRNLLAARPGLRISQPRNPSGKQVRTYVGIRVKP